MAAYTGNTTSLKLSTNEAAWYMMAAHRSGTANAEGRALVRAVQLIRLEGPSGLVVTEVPEPVPATDQVLIDVYAAGVSFPELLQTRGRYQQKVELPFVPGSEIAGVVRSAPPGSHV